MSIERLLRTEIADEISELNKLEVGSDKHKAAVDCVTKLVDRAIELEKVDMEHAERVESRKNDEELRRQQMNDDKKDRWIRNGLTAAGIIIPSVITVWGTLASFKFEETGTVTTIMGRGFINKLLPKK